MKQFLIVVLLVALSAIKANGQVGPVFPYTSPSKQALISLARQETAKGETYRNYLVKIINIGLRDTTLRVDARWVDYIFEHIFLEEVNLEDGMFKNSGYDPTANQMHPSLGHKIGWGFQWVFRVGTFTIVIIKRDCGNILEVPVIRTRVEIPQNIPDRFVQTERDQNQYAYTNIVKQERFVDPNPNLFVTKTIRTKTWFGRHWGWFAGVAVGSGLVVGGIYLHNNHHHHDDGGPGGAPKTDPIVVPPVIIPPVVVPGGPGGAPKTP